ncbi:HNH endonuclease [Burkholderia cepacia]|uniref:HNH endonuclease n=1 Tax=Burkholderia cepacia TaxID=292 RepID=UPI00398E6635
MIPAPVTYEGKIKDKVDAFNSLPMDEKEGGYWDQTNDGDLVDVKKHVKDYYIKVQDYVCPYCRQQIVVDHNAIWDAEHIISKDFRPDFMFEPENLCVSCKDCNGEKSNKIVVKRPKNKRFPRDSGAYLICHPHFDDYDQHLRLMKNPIFFIPRSDKGRETIEICGLLRFLYLVSEYGDVPIDIANQIGELQKALADATGAGEQALILTFIRDRCDEGIQMAQRARFAHLVKPRDADAP